MPFERTTVYKEDSYEIQTDQYIVSNKDTYSVCHSCPKDDKFRHAYGSFTFEQHRQREYSFETCLYCFKAPSEEFKTIFMLLIAGEKHFPMDKP